MEIHLDKNRKLIFEDIYFKIIREDALIESKKISSVAYSDILNAIYHPQKVNWIASILSFLAFGFLEIPENPVSGNIKRIEILFKNGSNRYIDIADIDKKIAMRIVNEINKRLKI